MSAIAALHTVSWQSAYRGILTDGFLDCEAGPTLLARWQQTRIEPEDIVLVAEHQGDMVGFVSVWCRDDVLVDNLHVAPALRGHGIGERLMQAAAERLLSAGRRSAFLYVLEDNVGAARFYRRLGGVVVDAFDKEMFGVQVKTLKIAWDDIADLLAAVRLP